MKKWVLIFTSIAILGISLGVYFENATSGIKPTISGLLESEYKPHYLKTETDNYKKLWNGKYRYTFPGYAEDGKKQEIVDFYCVEFLLLMMKKRGHK